jgi:hypothetical protein
VVVVGNDEALAWGAVQTTCLDPQRRSASTESGTELDAEVRAVDLDRGGAVVVDEGLRLGVITCCAAQSNERCQQHLDSVSENSHADGLSRAQLTVLDRPAEVTAFRGLP